MADVSIEDAAKEDWDLVALPGGMPGKLSNYSEFVKITFLLLRVLTKKMVFQFLQELLT